MLVYKLIVEYILRTLWTLLCTFKVGHRCGCSVAKLCPALCDPKKWSTTCFPVLHYLPEIAAAHVHWVSDAIQPSHPLSPPSPALSLSQHQALFQWVSSLHQGAQVLELQHQSFPWISAWAPEGLSGHGCAPGQPSPASSWLGLGGTERGLCPQGLSLGGWESSR